MWNVSDFASVYLVSMGRAEHGTSFQLKQLYEHNLQRAAFNFCYGPFGGVQGVYHQNLRHLAILNTDENWTEVIFF